MCDRMSDLKRRSWLKEFKGIDSQRLNEVRDGLVQPADPKMLDLKCFRDERGGLSVHSIELLGANGLIRKVGMRRVEYSRLNFSFRWPWVSISRYPAEVQTDETVFQALDRYPETLATRFIVVWKGHRNGLNTRVTIYRVPKKFVDINAWIASAMDEFMNETRS